MPNLGGIHLYDTDWPAHGVHTGQWWFDECSSFDLIRLIARSFRARNRFAASCETAVVGLDRGALQFEAVMSATVAVKEGLSLAEATSLVRRELKEELSDSFESLRVLLVHGNTLEESVSITLNRETEVTDTYSRYQVLLHTALFNQASAGLYDVVIKCDRRSIIDVHNEIRESLRVRGLDLEQLLSSVKKIYGFAGLSESGKSRSAEYLRKRKGVTRLKINYLLEVAAFRYGIEDVYTLTGAELAELLVMELANFARRQYYIPFLSIESLHRYDMSVQLKRLLGDNLIIVYCNAELEVRLSRSIGNESQLLTKDKVKRERGAHLIEEVSDVKVNNNGDLRTLYSQLDQIVCQTAFKRISPPIKSLEQLNLPAHLTSALDHFIQELTQSVGERLLLFAIIGSWAQGTGRPSTSDVDILIVIETYAFEQICKPVGNLLTTLADIRCGISVLTREELLSLRIDAKLMHALRLISRHEIGVQVISSNLFVPDVSAESDTFFSLDQWPMIIQTLRRELLQSRPNDRKIGKSCILLAKIILRIEGIELENEEEIIQTFNLKFFDKQRHSFLYEYRLGDPDGVTLGAAMLRWLESPTSSSRPHWRSEY